MSQTRALLSHASVCPCDTLCVVNIGSLLPRSTGEKMTETEIDALMAGQEDESGHVNYEGEPRNS